MTGCAQDCPREASQQDSASDGPVGATEVIARGLYEPSHGSVKKFKIRPSAVPAAHLVAGELSVWRISLDGFDTADLRARLEADKPGLFGILGVKASDVRKIPYGSSGHRAFCVVDECECDAEGNKHPKHAHIALCKGLAADGAGPEADDFIAAHRDLSELFKAMRLWQAAA